MLAHVTTFHNHVKYKCEYCNKVYAHLPSLSRHRKKMHVEVWGSVDSRKTK